MRYYISPESAVLLSRGMGKIRYLCDALAAVGKLMNFRAEAAGSRATSEESIGYRMEGRFSDSTEKLARTPRDSFAGKLERDPEGSCSEDPRAKFGSRSEACQDKALR